MKRTLLAIAFSALCASLVTGCFVAPVRPPIGSGFTEIAAPIDITFKGNPIGTREGSAQATAVLGLISTGDCSVQAAAQNGGLTRIDQIDYKYFNVLGIYQRFETVVTGQ